MNLKIKPELVLVFDSRRGFFELTPRDIVEVVGQKPITRREIWEILADRQGVYQHHFPRVNGILTATMVELSLSGWVERREGGNTVSYVSAADRSHAASYPFSEHFLEKLAKRFGGAVSYGRALHR